MNIEIITKVMELNMYGFSGVAPNKNHSETAFKLMDKIWRVIKTHDLKNKGKYLDV